MSAHRTDSEQDIQDFFFSTFSSIIFDLDKESSIHLYMPDCVTNKIWSGHGLVMNKNHSEDSAACDIFNLLNALRP